MQGLPRPEIFLANKFLDQTECVHGAANCHKRMAYLGPSEMWVYRVDGRPTERNFRKKMDNS